MSYPLFRTGLGRDSHRFLPEDSSKPCLLGGVIFEDIPGLDAESDGDVILHALCNAISSLSHVPILGGVAKELCRKDGITDSQVYLERALKTLGPQKIVHVSIAVEGQRPRFEEKIRLIRKRIAQILQLSEDQVGFTANSGDGLTDFACGDGLLCHCILTTMEIK